MKKRKNKIFVGQATNGATLMAETLDRMSTLPVIVQTPAETQGHTPPQAEPGIVLDASAPESLPIAPNMDEMGSTTVMSTTTATVEAEATGTDPIPVQPDQTQTVVAELTEPDPASSRPQPAPALVAVPALTDLPFNRQVLMNARREMREDMSSRLRGMMSDIRLGLKAELAEVAGDLRDAMLADLAARFEALNQQLGGKVNPILRPSLRSRAKELKNILIATLTQSMIEEGRTDSEEMAKEAKEMADGIIREICPNLGKLFPGSGPIS